MRLTKGLDLEKKKVQLKVCLLLQHHRQRHSLDCRYFRVVITAIDYNFTWPHKGSMNQIKIFI